VVFLFVELFLCEIFRRKREFTCFFFGNCWFETAMFTTTVEERIRLPVPKPDGGYVAKGSCFNEWKKGKNERMKGKWENCMKARLWRAFTEMSCADATVFLNSETGKLLFDTMGEEELLWDHDEEGFLDFLVKDDKKEKDAKKKKAKKVEVVKDGRKRQLFIAWWMCYYVQDIVTPRLLKKLYVDIAAYADEIREKGIRVTYLELINTIYACILGGSVETKTHRAIARVMCFDRVQMDLEETCNEFMLMLGIEERRAKRLSTEYYPNDEEDAKASYVRSTVFLRDLFYDCVWAQTTNSEKMWIRGEKCEKSLRDIIKKLRKTKYEDKPKRVLGERYEPPIVEWKEGCEAPESESEDDKNDTNPDFNKKHVCRICGGTCGSILDCARYVQGHCERCGDTRHTMKQCKYSEVVCHVCRKNNHNTKKCFYITHKTKDVKKKDEGEK